VLHSFRIHIHGMLVYGFDHDDWQTLKNTVKFAKKSRLNSTQFLILTPLPGSELFDRMRANGLITGFCLITGRFMMPIMWFLNQKSVSEL